MNRRALLLAGLATLPAVALGGTVSAQDRQPTPGRHRTSKTKPAARRRVRAHRAPGRGGLTASRVRTRIVTRTFTSSGPITIPITIAEEPATGRPYPSTIQVRGFKQGRILKTRVTLLGLTHAWPAHLDILLVAPGNIGVILMSDAGDDDVTNLTISFDQDAPKVLPEPLVGGTFQPVNNYYIPDLFPAPAPPGITGHFLTRFTNRNPNGPWQLYVVDGAPAIDGGSIAGWTLQLRVRERVRRRQGRGGPRRPRRQRPT